jgi:integrase
MIGAHRSIGGLAMRRDEKPLRRKNPGGAIVWAARYTGDDGKRRSAGTFRAKGPCKAPGKACCAQHAIWAAYEAVAPREGAESVSGYFAHWLADHPRPARTEAGYTSRVKAVLELDVDGRRFGDWPMPEVRPRQIDRLVGVLLGQGRAASGTRAVVSVLSAMFRDARVDGVVEFNPASDVTIRERDPRVRRPKRKPILASWEQMHEFAAAAAPYEAMVRVLSDCGLRLGEMLALEPVNVRGDALVVKNKAWHGRSEPGTKQSDEDGRVVPVPPALRAMLAGMPTPLRGPLFPDPAGGYWHERTFYRVVWHPAQRASGLVLNPHDFRHSFVSHMRAAGVDPADLAAAAGHTLDTATRIYTHSTGATFDAMRRAVG